MSHLNFNHLYYFWVVAREGSIVRAARELHVTPQTISGQLKTLEARLGVTLLRKVGRNLQLTEAGRLAHSYVGPMFQLGLELNAAVRTRILGQDVRATIGIESCVPRPIALKLLGPALRAEASSVVCYSARREALLADVAAHRADIVITEGPGDSGPAGSIQYVPVAESGISFLCAQEEAARLTFGFPRSLSNVDFLAPVRSGHFGSSLFAWFERAGVVPNAAAEFEDPVLMYELAEEGGCAFAVATELEESVLSRYRLGVFGRTSEVSVTYYALHRGCSYSHALIAAMDAGICQSGKIGAAARGNQNGRDIAAVVLDGRREPALVSVRGAA